MQLTGGRFKGIKLATSKGAKGSSDIRPTLSKVRESVFNVLAAHFSRTGGDFSGLKFLDCFSGSGIMALEAFSRGFDVLAIEKDHANAHIIKENFKKVSAEIPVIVGDALKFKVKESFDVIYLDPPWGFDYEVIIRTAREKLNSLNRSGVIVCEHEGEIPTCGLEILREKKYGRSRLTLLGSNF